MRHYQFLLWKFRAWRPADEFGYISPCLERIKFILGFFAASLIASFIAVPAFGKESVSSINSVLDQYKNWAFVLAFTSIGLETNFREIKEQFQGGKPLTLYVVGQLFNIVLTFAAVYLLLS